MADISFKAKLETIYNVDNTPAYQRIKVPALDRKHCDMPAFRKHPRYGGLANSDMFKNVLSRIRKERLGDFIRLDRPLPEGVTIDATGFLTRVELDT